MKTTLACFARPDVIVMAVSCFLSPHLSVFFLLVRIHSLPRGFKMSDSEDSDFSGNASGSSDGEAEEAEGIEVTVS